MAPAKAQQLRAEPAEVVGLVLEVPGAVDQDQRAHPQNQQGHDPGQGIHPEGEFELEAGNPGNHFGDRSGTGVGIDGAVLEEQPDKGGRGDRGQGIERVPAKPSEQQRGHSSHRKVHGKDCDHW